MMDTFVNEILFSHLLLQKINLQDYMLYAHGPDLCQEHTMKHAMADCFEALMGKAHFHK